MNIIELNAHKSEVDEVRFNVQVVAASEKTLRYYLHFHQTPAISEGSIRKTVRREESLRWTVDVYSMIDSGKQL